MNRIPAALVFALIFFSPYRCDAQDVFHVNRGEVVRAFMYISSVYSSTGMQGGKGEVIQCYQHVSAATSIAEVIKCLAMDMTLFFVDDTIAKQNNFPPTPYFTPKEVHDRFARMMAAHTSSRAQANNIGNELQGIIEPAVRNSLN